MTSATLRVGGGSDRVETMGRVALATQGLLYVIMGGLAVQIARGDHDAEASQRGALEAVARQPFGKALLAVLIVGLVAHAAWRIALAVRGEAGADDDSQSVAKRLGNVGRAAIYIGFTVVAAKLLTGSSSSSSGGGSGGSGGGGGTEQKGTEKLLDLPGGTAIVVVLGLVVIGSGVWNVVKGVTRKFEDDLSLGSLDESKRKAVVSFGTIGYAARGIAFGLVGGFLLRAGLTHDADKTKGLDGALREVAEATYGPWLLSLLAVGLVLFGLYRALDGRYRKASELTHS
jgi:Domain of Unknown Function (DUF1206)